MQLHLNTYGTYLHVKDQMFEIKLTKEGKVEKHHKAAHKVKSIWIGEGIAMSSDAIKLALKYHIDILFMEWNDRPLGRIWHSKPGSTVKILRQQLAAGTDERGLKYTQQWLGRKLQNQISHLERLKKHRTKDREYLDKKIHQIQQRRISILELKAPQVEEVAESIRGWEGTAGRFYFEALSHVFPKNYTFKGRSFRPAEDTFNAFLNYGYAVLYAQVEKALMIAGLNPFIGFLHRDDYNHRSMVYDFIEVYRVFIERVVFKLFAAKRVNKSHIDVITNGIKLNKEGIQLLLEDLNEYLYDEKVRYKGKNRTRLNIIQLEAHQFASQLIGKEPYKELELIIF